MEDKCLYINGLNKNFLNTTRLQWKIYRFNRSDIYMKKVISIISPQWGTAGTDINLLKIAEGLVNEEFDVRLLIVGDEWFDKIIKSEI